MVELAPEVASLVEAAKALDIGLPHNRAEDSGGGSGNVGTVSPIVQAYAKSIQEDGKALKALSAGLLLGREKAAKLRRVVALIAEAHTRTKSKSHVYVPLLPRTVLCLCACGLMMRLTDDCWTRLIDQWNGMMDGSTTGRYTTGIGKSGLVAARLASSLRSISIRSSHVPGNEWVCMCRYGCVCGID